MNKILWKNYLNSIINTRDSYPLPFPTIDNRLTYCFKLSRNYNNVKLFTINPLKGLNDIEKLKELFDEYRIVAMNIYVNNGEYCKNSKKEMIQDHTYRKGTFKLIYWPNFPKMGEKDENENWVFNSENLEIYVNYEVIPKYTNLMIPRQSYYTNLKGFREEYNMIKKEGVEIEIRNDILEKEIKEDIKEFIEFFRNNNN